MNLKELYEQVKYLYDNYHESTRVNLVIPNNSGFIFTTPQIYYESASDTIEIQD